MLPACNHLYFDENQSLMFLQQVNNRRSIVLHYAVGAVLSHRPTENVTPARRLKRFRSPLDLRRLEMFKNSLKHIKKRPRFQTH